MTCYSEPTDGSLIAAQFWLPADHKFGQANTVLSLYSAKCFRKCFNTSRIIYVWDFVDHPVYFIGKTVLYLRP
jgi:hypothetical protein